MNCSSDFNLAMLHYTAPPIVGGVEAVMQAHAGVFTQNNINTTVLAGRGSGKNLPEGVNLSVIPELDSQSPLISDINLALIKGKVPAAFEPMVDRLADLLRPELESFTHVLVHNIFTKHFNLPLTAALFRLLDEGISSRLIAWCHDFSWTSPNSYCRVHPGYPWDILRTYRDDLTYVVVSQHRKQELVGLFSCPPERIHVIMNGVEPQSLLGLSTQGFTLIEKLSIFERDLVLLMPVRVTGAKNIEFAMQVIAVLKEKGLSVCLVITGPPDPHDEESMAYFRELKALSAGLNIKDQVRFIYESGEQSHVPCIIDEGVVGELYRVSDIVFMPSHREGFGMPILEAGLVGMPVVCTAVPAAVEVGVQDVRMFEYDDDPERVAAIILDLVKTSPVHQLRRKVRQNYTWKAIFHQSILPLLQGLKTG